jgi:transketolase
MTKTPGVDMSTGSLGQGLSAGDRPWRSALRGTDWTPAFTRFSGDGEMQGRTIWEAVSFGGRKKVKNIIAILDQQQAALTGRAADVLDLKSVSRRKIEVSDGA